MKHLLLRPLYLALVLALLGACNSAAEPPAAAPASGAGALAAETALPGTSGAERAEKQELRVVENVALRSAVGLVPGSWGAYGVAGLLWAPLLGHSSDWKETIPTGVAESWNVSGDGALYSFKLRKEAKFSDGSPITAKVVAWNINHALMQGHPDIYGKKALGYASRQLLSDIVGAAEVFDGSAGPSDEFGAANVAGVRVVDQSTLSIRLTQPSPTFLLRLAYGNVSMVKPESVMAGKGKTYDDNTYWTTEPGVAFSGSYILKEFQPGKGMVLTPNPNFWGDAPILQRIIVTFAHDAQAAIAAFKNREADVVALVLTPLDVLALQTSDYLRQSLFEVESYSVNQLYVTPFAPFDDVHVRRAVSMAIDRQALVDTLGGGVRQKFYTPLTAHFTPAQPACADAFAKVKGMPFDPDAARAELAKSSYADKIKDIEINIQLGMFGQNPTQNGLEARAIQKMLAEHLGLTKVTIRSEPIADVNAPPYPTQLWMNEQGQNQPDVMAFMNNLAALNTAGSLPDPAKMSMLAMPRVPELRTLMAEAAKETDGAKRCEILAQAQQVWVNQVFTIDLFTFNEYRLIAPHVRGLKLCCGNLNYLWFEPGIAKAYLAKP